MRNFSVLLLANLVWLLAGYAADAAEADRAIVPVMKLAAPNVNHVRVLNRAQVNAELDLVIAFGTPGNSPIGTGEAIWWSDKSVIGLFLQQRVKPDPVYQLATEFGIAVVAKGGARRFFVDQMSDGRLRVAESVHGE